MKYVLWNAVNLFFTIFFWLILARIIMSWIRPSTYSPLYARVAGFVYEVTEPVMAPVRRMLPLSGFGFDFSPIVVVLLLQLLRQVLLQLIIRLPF